VSFGDSNAVSAMRGFRPRCRCFRPNSFVVLVLHRFMGKWCIGPTPGCERQSRRCARRLRALRTAKFGFCGHSEIWRKNQEVSGRHRPRRMVEHQPIQPQLFHGRGKAFEVHRFDDVARPVFPPPKAGTLNLIFFNIRQQVLSQRAFCG
jgi:hypothetical protein